VNELREWGVEFVFLRESINTTPPGGKLVFHVFGAVAAFERDLILERTMGGWCRQGAAGGTDASS
jgi:DNA invertase Pin-like site-specific DNA recombinase